MIAVIDYGLGNVRSVLSAVARLGYEAVLSRDPEELARADKFILPGVGAFGDAMARLHRLGLVEILNELVLGRGKQVLGICLGMQLLCESSTEFGDHEGLGWLPAEVHRLKGGNGLRLPHVGWDDLRQEHDTPLFADIPEDALFYYVHTFHAMSRDPKIVVGTCDYGMPFAACMSMNNVHGTQFHPEKSQLHGLTLLKNFLALEGDQ
ncbi:Imidazole glycerol phosphate synthase subunit HisH 1 [Pseudodesulfovibrio hydrargyri]|uniref:Imidazole glycerol phosphate synthase subunit HisH n=1 Tax=Pseudodesulfovibrio hydrargyri TaxID=2125990 RepID=A0A1J5MW70_9BACT|nr:imidazole glycerol phosphate synthase subunit HisH [Pseudodesulfovibrio hydrargyri]OIQ50052.1 Imidazole glycerol phosphate synthase subunit HisH 1 [Pseudodesulfovibrio hydrargyri]